MPGPHLPDPQRPQGLERSIAGPPAADFGTASPCGGRPYGGPAGALTFGLFRAADEFLESHPTHSALSLDIEGMERKATPPTFFTERSLAAYLAVSDRTIRNWIRRGELPSYKLGAARRIDPADVDAFLAERRDEAA
jgi:excisionase family DNA binding protein